MPRRSTAEDWPVPQDAALRPPVSESETLVGAPGPPPDARRWYDDHLAHRHHHHAATQPRTVVVTTVAKPKTPKALAMPPLVGLTEQQAVARLRQSHITATIVQKPSSRPRGVVVSETPAVASPVSAKTPVTLVVSTGVATVAVPNLVGQAAGSARASLQTLGLRTATTSVTMPGKPAGTVVDQAPKPGKQIAKNGLVTLSIAKGTATTQTTTKTQTTAQTTTAAAAAPAQPKTATVPDVSGQDEVAAVQAFAQAGILPSLVFVSSSDPMGTVEAQAKPQGTTVPYHSHVQINISSGQSPTMEHVPNVVGMTLQQALAAINAAHLKMIYVKLTGPRAEAGKIVQQTPLAAGGAPENAQVLVFLGVYR